MSAPSDMEIERVLIELDQMCETFEQRGWPMQAAEAEQLYINVHRRIGRAIPERRTGRLMKELAEAGKLRRRVTDSPLQQTPDRLVGSAETEASRQG